MPADTAHPAAHPLYPRLLRPRIVEALEDTPVVLVSGPRQAGKTTLVRMLAGEARRYLTLDDRAVRTAAREDPAGLIRSLDRAVIDEIQRAPELLLAIKQSVDEDRRPGRFLLTGSANVMTLPTVADSLAGRMENLALLPLAQCEMAPAPGASTAWLDAVFAGQIPRPAHADPAAEVGEGLVQRVLRGGYPEAIAVGHPLGASGARLALTAARELERRNGRYAVLSLCIGVGQGLAVVIERM